MPRLHKVEAGTEAGMPASASWRLRDTGEIRCTSQDPGVLRNVQQMRTPRETPARRNVLGLRRGSVGAAGRRGGRPRGTAKPTKGLTSNPIYGGVLQHVTTNAIL